jgi:predicted lipoprotein with Yx(FWY)xxD motif
MMKAVVRSVVVATALSLGAGAFAQGMAQGMVQGMAPAKTAETSKGKTLVDQKGMTLYTFDKDTAGKSACNGPCTANWPPLSADASAAVMGEWTILTREDGSKQWAYKAKPVYTYAKDTKAGDVTGDGFLNGAWHVAMP